MVLDGSGLLRRASVHVARNVVDLGHVLTILLGEAALNRSDGVSRVLSDEVFPVSFTQLEAAPFLVDSAQVHMSGPWLFLMTFRGATSIFDRYLHHRGNAIWHERLDLSSLGVTPDCSKVTRTAEHGVAMSFLGPNSLDLVAVPAISYRSCQLRLRTHRISA
jgi:hypothetical protein